MVTNFFKNNYNLRKSLYTLGIVILSIVFFRYTENAKLVNLIPSILKVMKPFIIGAVLAYVLNCGTNCLEKNILSKLEYFKTQPNKSRAVSITIAFLLLIGVVVGIIAYIIPEIVSSVQNVVNFFVGIDSDTVHEYLNSFLTKHNIDISVSTYRSLLKTTDNAMNSLTSSLKYMPEMLTSIATHTISFASSLVSIIMGIMIAIYMLLDKEKLLHFCKKTLFILFSKKQVESIASTIKYTNSVFNSFVVGKTIDSLIIAIIFFIGSIILNLPYPMLFAIIIGITNMIPYFGPFIGAVPVVALTILINPIKGLWVLIFIVVLKQLDGVILGPRILGDSIGLKPIGVIFAIIVGGAIAGPLGMFFGVPIFSVIFTIFSNFVEKLYNSKNTVKNKLEKETKKDDDTEKSE